MGASVHERQLEEGRLGDVMAGASSPRQGLVCIRRESSLATNINHGPGALLIFSLDYCLYKTNR
jgi:hypothetical protein